MPLITWVDGKRLHVDFIEERHDKAGHPILDNPTHVPSKINYADQSFLINWKCQQVLNGAKAYVAPILDSDTYGRVWVPTELISLFGRDVSERIGDYVLRYASNVFWFEGIFKTL